MKKLPINFCIAVMLTLCFSVTSYSQINYNMCSGGSTDTIYDPYGNLFDSGGPGGVYQNYEDCSLLVAVPGAAITIMFSQFNTESCCDQLYIYDGPTTAYPLMLTAAGTIIPAPVVCNSGYMLIVWHSDLSITPDGWKATWTTEDVYDRSGIVFYDENNNGIKEGIETGLYSARINVLPDSGVSMTNLSGVFHYYEVVANPHTLTCVPPAGWHISSDSLSYTVPVDTNDLSGYDFGCYPDTLFHRLELHGGSGLPRCNTDVNYWISYTNTGTIAESGTVKFVLDTAVSFVSSAPAPDAIVGDTLFYNFTLLNPFQMHQIHLLLHFPGPGDTLQFITMIEADSSGFAVYNAERTVEEIVRCSIDPNDKAVTPAGVEASHYTLYPALLNYTVRFQNTGNDTAFTVIIRDTISSSLDINTLRVVGSSAMVSVNISSGNIVEFRFPNILLPDSNVDEPGSNGYVQYTIAARSGLTLPVDVNNTAYIYFDLNAAVQTNTTTNQLVLEIPTTVHEIASQKNVAKVVPNPFHNGAEIFVNDIRFASSTTLKVMNTLGEEIFIQKIENGNQKISGSNFVQGIYFFELNNKSGESVFGKFIVE